jgi:hypothetical protein
MNDRAGLGNFGSQAAISVGRFVEILRRLVGDVGGGERNLNEKTGDQKI